MLTLSVSHDMATTTRTTNSIEDVLWSIGMVSERMSSHIDRGSNGCDGQNGQTQSYNSRIDPKIWDGDKPTVEHILSVSRVVSRGFAVVVIR